MSAVVENEIIASAPPAELEVVGLEQVEGAAAEVPTTTSPRKYHFLKTEEIYQVVKHAAADIHVGDVALAERAIEVVDGFALAISKNVLRINETDGLSIVKKMDEFTSSLCCAIDKGVDVYGVKFVESVEKLGEVVMKNTEWVSEHARVRAIEAHKHMLTVSEKMSEGVSKAYTASEPYVKTAIDASEPYVQKGKGAVTAAAVTVDDYLKTWLNRIGQDYPDAAARVKQYIVTPHPTSALLALATAERRGEIIHNVTNAVNDKVTSAYGVVQNVLGTCQPYVHKAVDVASPYVNKAVDVASPYVNKAVGAAEPIISSPYVSGTTKQILEYSVVQSTISTTQTAVDAVKAYCTKKEAEDAVTPNTSCGFEAGVTEDAPSSSSAAAAAAAAPSGEATICPAGSAADLPPAPPTAVDQAAAAIASVGKDDESADATAVKLTETAIEAAAESASATAVAPNGDDAAAAAAATQATATTAEVNASPGRGKGKGGKNHKKGGGGHANSSNAE